MAQGLDALTREELVELLEITAKDLIALDGTWFQSLEREQGMDTAMEHDRAAWRRFVPSEARRLKKLLGLSDRCGLEGLAEALPLRCTSLANEWEILWEDDGAALVFRITDCRVQNARARKGMEFHPCKSVANWSTPASLPPWMTASTANASAAFPTSPTTPATAPGASGWRGSLEAYVLPKHKTVVDVRRLEAVTEALHFHEIGLRTEHDAKHRLLALGTMQLEVIRPPPVQVVLKRIERTLAPKLDSSWLRQQQSHFHRATPSLAALHPPRALREPFGWKVWKIFGRWPTEADRYSPPSRKPLILSSRASNSARAAFASFAPPTGSE